MDRNELAATRALYWIAKILGYIFALSFVAILGFYFQVGSSVLMVVVVFIFLFSLTNYVEGNAKKELDILEGNE